MGRILAMIAAAALVLPGCDRAEKPEMPEVKTPSDVPAVPPKADIPGEQPIPSVRAFPTGEVPDDPYLAAGHKVYRGACMVCHDRGAANAPPITDVVEWRTRIAKGKETLYKHAINGFTGSRGFMPPKGGSPGSWTDEQVRSAVDYMTYVVERQS